ncbi:hypothetical protein WR25_04721 [Diploscapter pachys]|uniref:Tyrosine-protein phosphatase domain-containing protein n=1 Tax=Diploscapter pachys TaxID=2018661 RepID=A0A2A2L6D6_9BILA|nr:hypothetical protein WR25_04721 [Diploscapter pachys]
MELQDIVCIDRTRVKLQQVDPKDDFIHANFLNFGDETYIATQYPLEDTISDFWRMVFFEEPRIIINLVPKGQQYPSFFKTGEGEYHTYKDMYVQTRRVEESKSYMISYLLEVLPDGHSNSIFVRLLHILNWPDNRTTKGLHTILKALHILAKKDATLCKGPPVVMCNSGLNKCGTLIFTNLMINNLFSNSSNEVSPISIYMNMRRMRASIIQTDLYYLQALIIVLDYLQWKNEKKLILDLTPEMLRIIREWKMEFYKKYEKEKTNG